MEWRGRREWEGWSGVEGPPLFLCLYVQEIYILALQNWSIIESASSREKRIVSVLPYSYIKPLDGWTLYINFSVISYKNIQ